VKERRNSTQRGRNARKLVKVHGEELENVATTNTTSSVELSQT